MFYFLASKYITFGNDSFRNIFIIGTICYIIVHAYLFGANAGETAQRFRHYLYYLFVVDAILATSYIYLFGKSTKETEHDDENDEVVPEISSSQQQSQLQQLGNGQNAGGGHSSNIEDVHRKLLELRARQELKLTQPKNPENGSPFAKKDNGPTKSTTETKKDKSLPQEQAEEQDEDDESVENEEKEKDKEGEADIPLYAPTTAAHKMNDDTDIPLYQ